MQALAQECSTAHSPETLAAQFAGEPGLVLLHSALRESAQARYSFVAARPFLTFRSFGSRCEVHLASIDPATRNLSSVQFGNPWHLLDGLMGRFELLDTADMPFPLGGCFGFWGYDLKNFVEPKLRAQAINDLELPDCCVGFYDSLVVFDHALGRTWIVSTGMEADGSRNPARAAQQMAFWQKRLGREPLPETTGLPRDASELTANLSRVDFLARVEQAQRYIRAGDIYQVNLSQRLAVPQPCSSWECFQRLSTVSPAPFAAFLDCGEFQLASSSPELFLRLSGGHVVTRPIKGTRPRSTDANEDARLAYELQSSPKEKAELVMITDLLRNDLGRVCEYGSVQVPDLMRLERYAHVQHLVSTVEGRLRPDVTHLAAMASCFPGGSITGAPKFHAMEIIDELEPTARGPFTGALGYLGFNRESQLSIIIRTAICKDGAAYFPVGAGIVADSQPEAEYAETLAKAAGFCTALAHRPAGELVALHPPTARNGARSIAP